MYACLEHEKVKADDLPAAALPRVLVAGEVGPIGPIGMAGPRSVWSAQLV